jgi:hypothetical protein
LAAASRRSPAPAAGQHPAPAARTSSTLSAAKPAASSSRLDQPAMHQPLPRRLRRLAPRRLQRHRLTGADLDPRAVQLALLEVRRRFVQHLIDQRLRRLPLRPRGRRMDVKQPDLVMAMQPALTV